MKTGQREEICRLVLQLARRSSDRTDHITFKASDSRVALEVEEVENEMSSENGGVSDADPSLWGPCQYE